MDLKLFDSSIRHSLLGLSVGAVYPVTVLDRNEGGSWNLEIQNHVVEAGARARLREGDRFWVRVDSIHPQVVLKILSTKKEGDLLM